jgi:hypothetical protein
MSVAAIRVAAKTPGDLGIMNEVAPFSTSPTPTVGLATGAPAGGEDL